MPPRWPRKPTRNDPAYRRLDDRMNFAVHVGLFAATNSGLWFFQTLRSAHWQWLIALTLSWMGLLLIHAIYIFAIADYQKQSTPNS
ncbi:2TM domain-containing protein [Kamptonema cortianum]|uniref:2TM domain-containing protein n=1 Tax=Geitlerinema calcuttense NRMC-F 0142 TaxID=2922238 RepID=A0ABT7LZY6_9CYAN|nr:2TM domain-containing protein [Geitlerinema calcuttense]MDI9636249.1 2TM domain-containing protein [Geitlerinema splendidum]MDK3158311.1 2TM domain-containing protein [Kamptonema cortianum]MDL5057576.1 2TM domain-containing protein [Geitlerinema calcuttense NRMC-F 0142]